MEAKELRIGNYVTQDGELIKGIVANTLFKFSVKQINLQPIKINEENIYKLGFINKKGDRYYHNEFDRLYVNISNPLIKHIGNFNGILKEVDYIHQLQNIFFCLTEKELIYDS